MRFAFDIGGTFSKYPKPFRHMVATLQANHDIFIITDMPERTKVVELLDRNELRWYVPDANILLADYATYGEACKAVLLREHSIDVLVDDHMGYLAWPWPTPAPLRLLVMPDPRRPYCCPSWVAGDGETFGRAAFLEGPTP
jgi:hypothetical protein